MKGMTHSSYSAHCKFIESHVWIKSVNIALTVGILLIIYKKQVIFISKL